MSRHSKWSKIKRQKGVSDQKRGNLFTKLCNAITIAARQGLPDPTMNFKLKVAVEKAKAANMPKDNIERAIARAKGAEGQALEQVQYEIIGPGGVGVIVSATTDNRNRTVSLIKHVLKEYDASFAGHHAILWQFELRGHILIDPPATREGRESLALAAIDAGAENIEEGEEVIAVTVNPHALESIKSAIEHAGFTVRETGLGLVPTVTVPLMDPDIAEKLDNLVAALEEIDEVDEVVTNAA